MWLLKFFTGYGGKCYACHRRFTKHDVPKWLRMADGNLRKICKGCFKVMGKPETPNTPRPVKQKVREQPQVPKLKKKNGKPRQQVTESWFY